MAFVCMSEKVIRPPPPNLCVVFLQRIPCIKIVCLVHKRLRVTRGVYVFIYRLLVGGVSWSFYSRDCSYLGGSFTVSGATWTLSGGVWPISGPLWQRGRNILVHLNYTWREIILRCLNSPHGHQTSLSDLIWKLCFWHVGPSEQVHRARSRCILCISACARLASIEVVYLRKCAAMRVNEYVSQLSSPLRLSWTEAGGQLQGRVTAEKKGGVKIDLREKKRFFIF